MRRQTLVGANGKERAELFAKFCAERCSVLPDMLEQLRNVSSEDIWNVLYEGGYCAQYEDGWTVFSPHLKLIGRAFTVQFLPWRPDLGETIEQHDATPTHQVSSAIVECLAPGDVLVVDIFGKKTGGAFAGDLVASALKRATGTGMVIDGALRDAEGINSLAMPTYCRAVHPTPLHDVMLTGINVPIRIGSSTIVPGDIVFGDARGISFIPPHLVSPILERAHRSKIQNDWVKAKLKISNLGLDQLYPEPVEESLRADFERYSNDHSSKKDGA